MNCCITDLRNKEVINTKNGCRLGCVSDVEICCENGCLTAIVIWGKNRFLGLGAPCEDIKIPWKDIQVIGDETILVCLDECACKRPSQDRKRPFDFMFRD